MCEFCDTSNYKEDWNGIDGVLYKTLVTAPHTELKLDIIYLKSARKYKYHICASDPFIAGTRIIFCPECGKKLVKE